MGEARRVFWDVSAQQRRNLLAVAWAIVLLITLPEIIIRGFMQMDTPWMLPARMGVLGTIFLLTFFTPKIRPLRGFCLMLLVNIVFEGWFFGMVIQQSHLFLTVFGDSPETLFFGERLLRVGASLVTLFVLLSMGLKRRDFFLTWGKFHAIAEPEAWAVPRKPETWLGFGGRFVLISVTIMLIFLIPAVKPTFSNLSIEVITFALVCAVMNAFAEEFMYRAALLPQVLPIFGKGASIFLIASWFGLAHYFGMPYGVTGVMITMIGGWIFAKSMVETEGMGWAVFLHFVSDFTLYLVILLAGGF